jgi:hypothetical protein
LVAAKEGHARPLAAVHIRHQADAVSRPSAISLSTAAVRHRPLSDDFAQPIQIPPVFDHSGMKGRTPRPVGRPAFQHVVHDGLADVDPRAVGSANTLPSAPMA